MPIAISVCGLFRCSSNRAETQEGRHFLLALYAKEMRPWIAPCARESPKKSNEIVSFVKLPWSRFIASGWPRKPSLCKVDARWDTTGWCQDDHNPPPWINLRTKEMVRHSSPFLRFIRVSVPETIISFLLRSFARLLHILLEIPSL